MSVCRYLLPLLAAALFLPPLAHADDPVTPAFSRAGKLDLCAGVGNNNPPIEPEVCKKNGYDKVSDDLDRALQATLSKAPANVQPLLKRDQGFFGEMVAAAGEEMPGSDNAEERQRFAGMLKGRLAALARIAQGFGRTGVLGAWENMLGNVTVTPADGGAYRVAFDINAIYGPADSEERQWHCQATALLKPAANGWLEGTMDAETKTGRDNEPKAAGADGKPLKPPTVKLHRQGETLRVVVVAALDANWENWPEVSHPSCRNDDALTGSYFASGKLDPALTPDKTDTSFVAPSFDCAHPFSAIDEEICADPELAADDVRLNHAWKALLPRLDEATRRALTDDQRHWIRAQGDLYTEFLHPYWNKLTYFMHYTSYARFELDSLQRERIALLEGFDEKRTGLTGVWLSYTAILNVTTADDGGIEAKGWKWEKGSWKDGCDFQIEGAIVKGVFRSAEKRKNPDTLERDGTMLIVNRLDDVFASKRHDLTDGDEPKCRRSYSNSSTVRLFPAKPSPDVNNFDRTR
jgi:uncharacterized protein YecT (DUF1311 family)